MGVREGFLEEIALEICLEGCTQVLWARRGTEWRHLLVWAHVCACEWDRAGEDVPG